MKAVLTYASYTPKTQEYSYMGCTNYMAIGSPMEATLNFNCITKDGHSMALILEGEGVPRIDCTNSEYEIEVIIKEKPKSVEKEYRIK